MPLKEIGRFSVSHLRILDEAGNVDRELEPKLDDDTLLRLHRAMTYAREGDQRLLKLQRQGRIGTFGPCTGQEASVCGPAFAMNADDWFVGSFRELGGRLARGESLINTFVFHNGFEEGNLQAPGATRLLPISIIVAAQTLHAVGIAYAMKLRGESAAVVTFLGDGGTSEGDFHEALNFAAVWQVPVVFVCQNNQWAISVPRGRQTHARTIAQKAIAYDLPGVQVDGNDVLAMYAAVKEALDRARAGGGPTLIEAVTYRLMMHTTADDPTRYREDVEVQTWWQRDPLVRFRRYLEAKGLWNDDRQALLETEIRQEIDAAVKEFEARPPVRPDAPFDHVYGTRHAVIEQQRAEFLADVAREEAEHA
ncbi:MAG: pyruvate dehydrogenase (acetyl-transferring) E1 component subunit alpha [Candidatus Krumholzibacteriia bacterium]